MVRDPELVPQQAAKPVLPTKYWFPLLVALIVSGAIFAVSEYAYRSFAITRGQMGQSMALQSQLLELQKTVYLAESGQRGFILTQDPLYLAYHDEEWGVPVHDDRHLFEMLTLEGAQAGLSWLTILRRREGYRRVFAGFDVAQVAAWGDAEIAQALEDPGIIRNRAKVESTVGNARAVLALQQ